MTERTDLQHIELIRDSLSNYANQTLDTDDSARAQLGESWCWLTDHLDWLEKGIQEWQRAYEASQARIDQLMLKHCPEEMTTEQLQRWAYHQRISPLKLHAALGKLIVETADVRI